jgi:hypothetical protein
MVPRSSIIVVTSLRWGTFAIRSDSSDKIDAARIGRAEFFEPEIVIVPVRGFPPLISNLSTKFSLKRLAKDRAE